MTRTKRKRWPAVEVEWQDAHGGDPGWISIDSHHSKPATIRTVGMLARESKAGLVIVLSRDSDADMTAGYVFIPKVNVVSVTRLSA